MAPNSRLLPATEGRDSLDLIRGPVLVALALFLGQLLLAGDQTDSLSGVSACRARGKARTLKGAKSLAMTCMKLMTAALAI